MAPRRDHHLEPLVFKPGQFDVLVALAGAVQYVFMTMHLGLAPTPATEPGC